MGAIVSVGKEASFSSIGPTFDGRMKPELTSFGVDNLVATTSSTTSYGYANGTSFAAPLIAGMFN